MGVRRVVPDLTSDRFDENRAFYTEVLGLDLAMNMGWVATFVSPVERLAQITIIGRDATAPVNPQESIQVDDVDAVYAAAGQQAAKMKIVYPLTDEAWGVRRFFVEDPNGGVVNALTHRVRG